MVGGSVVGGGVVGDGVVVGPRVVDVVTGGWVVKGQHGHSSHTLPCFSLRTSRSPPPEALHVI